MLVSPFSLQNCKMILITLLPQRGRVEGMVWAMVWTRVSEDALLRFDLLLHFEVLLKIRFAFTLPRSGA